MKKVISGENLYNKMHEAINLLCGTVKSTLGPKGNNIIIDNSTISPYITNDGVTIASNIESDDKEINTILELAKEASIKTNDSVGDGTTTTLVLLESIFNTGLSLINKGINPIILKKELTTSLNNIIKMIEKESSIPSNDDLKKIASISANDEEIGNIISQVYEKVKSKDAITISETNDDKTSVEYLNGYIFDTDIVSDYYFKDSSTVTLNECFILLVNTILEDTNDIESIINYINNNNTSLIIMADDYSELFVNEVLNLYLNEQIKIYLFKTPEYGTKRLNILKDLEAISQTKSLINTNYISPNNLGKIQKIKFDKNTSIIDYKTNSKITSRIKEIKEEKVTSSLDIEFINKRIAMFNNGLATIFVGSQTDTERKELKMRYDDALYAIDVAKKGIIPGGGLIYLKISDNLNIKNSGDEVLKDALTKPFFQILENSGIDSKEILNNIKSKNYKILFNILKNCYENINNTSVVDSTYVTINALKNACSIASMLLTTKHLIINEHTPNLKTDYNNL